MHVCIYGYEYMNACCDACIGMNKCILESITVHTAKSLERVAVVNLRTKLAIKGWGCEIPRTKPQLLAPQPQPQLCAGNGDYAVNNRSWKI